jgi:hypothetical protein
MVVIRSTVQKTEDPMGKHVADTTHTAKDGRLKHYVAVEKKRGKEGSHPAVKELNRRPADRSEKNRRAEEFARIDRGRTA